MAYDRERDWQAIKDRIGGPLGEEIAGIMKELYAVYDVRIVKWLASLYDPEIGAFYYSTPAKETDGYLPDIETTYFVLAGIMSLGMYRKKDGKFSDVTPEWLNVKVKAWLDSLQSEEDGYFYHPQWGNEVSILRKSRDLTSALATLEGLRMEPKYPTPLISAKKNSVDLSGVPENFRSVEAFTAYLERYDLSKSSYQIGSEILSQLPEIEAYGTMLGCDLKALVIEWFNKYKRDDTGLWHSELDYTAVNGLHKISWVYNSVGAPIRDPELCADSTLSVIMSDISPTHVVDVYNPWHSIGELLKNVKLFLPERADDFISYIRSKAPAAIRRTVEKIVEFKLPDGSISYSKGGCDFTSQGAPASPRDKRGSSVNGTFCGSASLTQSIYSALDLSDIEAPIFTEDDLEIFLSELEKVAGRK